MFQVELPADNWTRWNISGRSRGGLYAWTFRGQAMCAGCEADTLNAATREWEQWPGRGSVPGRQLLGLGGWLVLIGLVLRSPLPSLGQVPASSAEVLPVAVPAGSSEVEDRFRRLEALLSKQADQIEKLTGENQKLVEQVRDLSTGVQGLDPHSLPGASSLPLPDPSVAEPQSLFATPTFGSAPGVVPLSNPGLRDAVNSSGPATQHSSVDRPFLTGLYNDGFVLVAPSDKQKTPFALKLNISTQVRYTGFYRSVDNWTDSAGQVWPVMNHSYFALNRNFFSFSGYAFSPELMYNVTVFSTSTTNQTLAIGALSYVLDKGLAVNAGYYKVPGTREWLEPIRQLGADRTMANTFFRPSVSPGFWLSGEPLEHLHYIAGIYNDFNSMSSSAFRTNTNMTYAGNVWWEPLGEFGVGYGDVAYHEKPVMRTGSSLVFSRSRLEPNPNPYETNPENTVLRLSDGTPLYEPGALGKGISVNATNVLLYTYDLAFKYRGFSLSGEYYARWLSDLGTAKGAVPAAYQTIFDNGGLAQVSAPLVPRHLELFARSSGVFGRFGSGTEYGGGLNWYIRGNPHVRATLEAKRINHSPASNILYGYFAGQSGTLLQLQLQTEF